LSRATQIQTSVIFTDGHCFTPKGPMGEQLEFNQVTRGIKRLFINAQGEYHKAYGTEFRWPSATITKIKK
jgi:hypothetical protein